MVAQKTGRGQELHGVELQALLMCLFWPPNHCGSLLVCSYLCKLDVPRHVCQEMKPAGDGDAVAASCWLSSHLSTCCGAVTKIGSPSAVCQVSLPWGHGGLYKGSEGT